jgi:DNA/RNA-binding domain of Phe-tRNA-synthetase-like protein
MQLIISEHIRKACPELTLGIIECKVKNSESSDKLWEEMEAEMQQISLKYKLEEINKRAEIQATRQIYKRLGKDPNRYRPSAEALCRRIVRGIPIYRLNTLVDIINIVSIRSGYSIGAFDKKLISGDLILDVGKSSDIFDAIGRGLLNIEGLPVYRDSVGGIGTPTSDNERTKITENTTELLIIINAYSGITDLNNAMTHCLELLEKYAEATNFSTAIVD